MRAGQVIPGFRCSQKSRKLKKRFVLKEGEMLIITAGKTLTITGGAEFYGNIYIEKGGKLKLEWYSTRLYGGVFCDGTLSVTGGTFHVFDEALLYISETGKFNAADRGICEPEDGYELNGRVYISPNANSVCLGDTNIPDPYLSAEPVAAVYKREDFDGAKIFTEVITDKTRLNALINLPDNNSPSFSDGDFADCYTVLFDGGGAVTYTAYGNVDNGFNIIGGFDVQLIFSVLDRFHRHEELKIAENAFGNSSNAVRARYVSHTADEDTVTYTFEVVNIIALPIDWNIQKGIGETFTLKRDREWSDEYTQEFTDGEYILPLKSVKPKNGESYYVLARDVYIPVNEGAADCVYISGEKCGLASPVTVEYIKNIAGNAVSYPELDIAGE